MPTNCSLAFVNEFKAQRANQRLKVLIRINIQTKWGRIRNTRLICVWVYLVLVSRWSQFCGSVVRILIHILPWLSLRTRMIGVGALIAILLQSSFLRIIFVLPSESVEVKMPLYNLFIVHKPVHGHKLLFSVDHSLWAILKLSGWFSSFFLNKLITTIFNELFIGSL